MSIESILREELERLQEAQKSYRREIDSLPKGSIQRKKINGSAYPYLMFRVGKRVNSRYLGGMPKDRLEQLQKDIELRHKREEMLNKVRKNIFDINRMIHARRRSG